MQKGGLALHEMAVKFEVCLLSNVLTGERHFCVDAETILAAEMRLTPKDAKLANGCHPLQYTSAEEYIFSRSLISNLTRLIWKFRKCHLMNYFANASLNFSRLPLKA